MTMTDEQKIEGAVASISKFKDIMSLAVNKEDPSSLTHQLVQLHNAIPSAVNAREALGYYLSKEKANNGGKIDSYSFYYNWACGLINECHYQITILSTLLNYIK